MSLIQEGQIVPNNTLLSLDSLGDFNQTTISPLFCVTNQPLCCDTNRSGNWFPPGGDDPVGDSDNTTELYQSWGDDQSVQLLRPTGVDTVESGLYRCEIPDQDNITQTFYVGIYSEEEGEITAILSCVVIVVVS